MAGRLVPMIVWVLLGSVALAGCLEDPSPVYVPASLVPSDWNREAHNESRSAAGGNLEMIINQYAFGDDLVAEVFLVGVTDVPLVDEVDQLREQVDRRVQQEQIEVTKTNERSMTLDNGQVVDLVEFEIRKEGMTGEARGKAWRMAWNDGEFVGVGFGYATTEYSGLLGTVEDDTQWQNVQRMMRAADW